MIAKSVLLTAALLTSGVRHALSFTFVPHAATPTITATSLTSGGARTTTTPTRRSSSKSPLKSSSSSDDNVPHYLENRPRPPPPRGSLCSPPNLLRRIRLRLGLAKHLREAVVHKYFHGVDTKNVSQIVECFHPEGAIIRDVCALSNRDASYEDVGRLVAPEFLGERCRSFLAAHPDAKVMFHYSPTCGRGRNNRWVHAHWYETGTWSGASEGIEPDGSPLNVQGQTRFLVDDDLRIREIVIARTFSRWEEMVSSKEEED